MLRVTIGGNAELACGAVLFDMDGVLVDSMPAIRRHLRTWALSHDLDPARVLEVAHGRTYPELIRLLLPCSNVSHETQRCIESEERFVVEPCRGVVELLALLPPGSWGIVTSAYLRVARSRLSAAGIAAPSVLVTADDVARGKPDPEGYLLAASCLEVDPRECVVIDDAPNGARAGRSAGCRVIGIGSNDSADWSDAEVVVSDLTSLTITDARIE